MGLSVPIMPSEPKISFEPQPADDEEAVSTMPIVEGGGLFSRYVFSRKLLISRFINEN